MTHVAHALAEPIPHLPMRRPGSVRRTSHVDVTELPEGGLELTGMAHQDAGPVTLAVSCRAELAADRTLVSLALEPEVAGAARLVGRLVGRGFRAAVDEVCEPGTLASVLLTELPVVALLSGYGILYSGRLTTSLTDKFIRGLPIDVCAGWAGTSFMVGHIEEQREIPTPDGPDVPLDTEGWHPMPDLARGVLRRQRLIERNGDQVWAMFRDSYARPDGVRTVLHEYTVAATVSPGPGGCGGPGGSGGSGGPGGPGGSDVVERITACEATPRVLPWAECPQAAASAGRLVGRPVAELRALVRDDLVGTSTCTHLNDLLSSLSQAGRLV